MFWNHSAGCERNQDGDAQAIGFVEPKKEHKKRAATEKPAAGK